MTVDYEMIARDIKIGHLISEVATAVDFSQEKKIASVLVGIYEFQTNIWYCENKCKNETIAECQKW